MRPETDANAMNPSARNFFSGFVQGTLVHTREGLKPIDQIRPGDWVLAQDQPDEQPRYARVLDVLSSPAAALTAVAYQAASGVGPTQYLFTTGKQRFHCADSGWMPAEELHDRSSLPWRPSTLEEASKPARLLVDSVGQRMWRCRGPQQLFVAGRPDEDVVAATPRPGLGDGCLMNYRTHEVLGMDDGAIEILESLGEDSPRFTRPVWALVIEGAHSLFVTEHGLWVRDATHPPSSGGFPGWTLVHTQAGPKPIAQIQAGDQVLAKPEHGGEWAYRRVLEVSQNAAGRMVEVNYAQPGQDLSYEQLTKGIRLARLFASADQPIWTESEGWMECGRLQGYGSGHFQFESGTDAGINSWGVSDVFVSDRPHVGWIGKGGGGGMLWDFLENKFLGANMPAIDAVVDIDYCDNPQALYFRTPVFRLVVEDAGTYCVGEHGLWVHS